MIGLSLNEPAFNIPNKKFYISSQKQDLILTGFLTRDTVEYFNFLTLVQCHIVKRLKTCASEDSKKALERGVC